MQLSDTTNQSGLVQRVEFWSRIPYGSSGNELRTIINNINVSFDKIMPLLLTDSTHIRWDDPNHTDAPIGYVNIVANQHDYKITVDENSLDILNITHLRILQSSTDTSYVEIERANSDHEDIAEYLSPDISVTGVPDRFVVLGNRIYLNKIPNYSATDGMEIFFGREQNRFTVTGTSGDDTTEPGIPKPFHELLALYAAQMQVSVDRPKDTNTLNIIENKIREMREDLETATSLRNPTNDRMTMKPNNYE